MMIRAALICLMLVGPAWAQQDPATEARNAATLLEEAAIALAQADGARDRVAALTATVKGYEAGLAAMRDGLRAATIREQTLTAELTARRDDVAQLLGVLQTIGRSSGPVLLLHPSGPTGTARAGMLLADVTPALQSRTDALARDLAEVTTLRQLQQDAANRLKEGLSGAQQARTALSQAISERTDLPQRFTENPMQTAALIGATETLEGFASGLTQIAENEAPGHLPDISERMGQLPLPVQGRILHRAGDTDAAGIQRPGIILATRPRALVTTPTPATIRYRGPLLDYGQVMILEPQKDMLIVLAGLDVVFGEAGQVLPQGSPVGLMGGQDAQIGAILSQSSDGAGSDATETLYIEVRQGADTVDPEIWFKTHND